MKLLEKLGVALLSLSLVGAAMAQSNSPNCPPPLPTPSNTYWVERSKSPTSAGLLWTVEKDARTSWLYGTIHINSVEFAMPGAPILDAIKAVDTVVLELDVSTPEKAKQLTTELTKKPTTNSANAKPFSERTVARIKAFVDTLCMPTESFLKLPPNLLPAGLPMHALRYKGLYPEFMMDAFIGGLATGLKKPVVALETAQSQLTAFSDSDPAASADAAMNEALNKLASGEAQRLIEKLFDVWVRGDLAEFERFYDWCDCMKTPKQQQQMTRLNDDRNTQMMTQIAQMLSQSKQLFVAVGALHMIGEKGLPTLLRQQGFKVTQVKVAP